MGKLLLFLLILSFKIGYAQIQDEQSIPITPQVIANIKAQVEKSIPLFKKQLSSRELQPYEVEFMVDTFKIEAFQKRWMELNNNFSSIEDASFKAAKQYDVLLNKYYKKLLAALPDGAKPLIIKTQRSWLVYRDNQYKMAQAVSYIKYQTGTLQGLDNAAAYLSLIKERVLTLYGEYYDLFVNKG